METTARENFKMREDLQVGNKFPNLELPDQDGNRRKLSELLRGFPGALIFGRGHF
jgi:peroxiredoxin